MNNVTFMKDKSETSLGAFDLFDRVINVRLKAVTASGKEETIVIRSDWEPVQESWSGVETVRFRKCVHKPSITFKSRQVTRDVDVSVSLSISNFVMFTSDGTMLTSFSNNDYKVTYLEVTLGYFGQCRQSPPASWAEFMDITPLPGMDMKTCDTILAIYTPKLPPDLTLQIEAACANVLAVPAGEDSVEFSGRSFDELQQSGWLREAETGSGAVADAVRSYVLDYYQPKGTGLTYKLYATDRVLDMALDTYTDADGNDVPMLLADYKCEGLTIRQALTRFFEELGLTGMQFKLLDAGKVFLYMWEDLDDPDMLADSFQELYKESALEKFYDGKLPAVESIVINETATIVCPFFAFIGPFQRFKFENRYSISSMVKYWAGSASQKTDTFYAISVDVAFSTTDNLNEVQLFCTIQNNGGTDL